MTEHHGVAGLSYGLKMPPAEASHRAALQRLAQTLRRDELVWLLSERYDATHGHWQLELLRPSASGHWSRQRYRYDGQAETLYFLGESALSDAEFRHARAAAAVFPIADLQDQPA